MYDDSSTEQAYLDAVLKMTVGTINATLVESSYGYHIIKLNAVNANGRANSTSSKEEYVNSNINKLTDTENLVVDQGRLEKLVTQLKGTSSSAASSSDASTSATGDDTTSTDTTTDSSASAQ